MTYIDLESYESSKIMKSVLDDWWMKNRENEGGSMVWCQTNSRAHFPPCIYLIPTLFDDVLLASSSLTCSLNER